jgi:hypothetical protein
MSPSEPKTVEDARRDLFAQARYVDRPESAYTKRVEAFEAAVRRDERARIYRAEHDEKYGVSA